MTMPGFGPLGPEAFMQLRNQLLLGGQGDQAQQQQQGMGGAGVDPSVLAALTGGAAPAEATPGGVAPAAPQKPKTWGQTFEDRVLGIHAQTLEQPYRQDALAQGLLQGALALAGRGGARANWGTALVTGLLGARSGVAQGMESQDLAHYRADLQKRIDASTDPEERLRYEYMMRNPTQYERPAKPSPVEQGHFEAAPDGMFKTPHVAKFAYLPDPSSPTGSTRVQIGPWQRPPSSTGQGDRVTLAMQARNRKILEARARVERMDLFDRQGLQTSDPALYQQAISSTIDPNGDPEYSDWVDRMFPAQHYEPPKQGPGLLDAITKGIKSGAAGLAGIAGAPPPRRKAAKAPKAAPPPAVVDELDDEYE